MLTEESLVNGQVTGLQIENLEGVVAVSKCLPVRSCGIRQRITAIAKPLTNGENKSWILSSHPLLSCWCLPNGQTQLETESKGVHETMYIEISFPEYRAGKREIVIETGGANEKHTVCMAYFCTAVTLLRQCPLPFIAFPLQNYRAYNSLCGYRS